MNSHQVASKGRSAIGILLVGIFLIISNAVRAAPVNDLEDPAQWPAETPQISLSEDAWEVYEAPVARLARPIRNASRLCRSCEFHLGVGGTYHSFKSTSGVVIPATVTWDRGRWEFGVFRFASTQSSSDNDEHTEQLVAHPYWGASLSRRFQLVEHGPLRAFFGFGLSYKTEQDILSVTHWNFSSQLGMRFEAPGFPATFELSARHWSNGGVKTPNRGQDFTVLSVRFDR